MSLEDLVQHAAAARASDLHVEPGYAPTLRIDGDLTPFGEPLDGTAPHGFARALLDEDAWTRFLEQGSHDLSATIAGVRCRINVLRTARGVGLAIRLLARAARSVAHLNLHPDLARLVEPSHGLVIVSGPTGSGKSSTLAALVEEVNAHRAAHVVTIESPIEFAFEPRRAFIRQREVGRDTPSFDQALVDALREDPDVLMVGEMRTASTMRLTLDASETGHLVLTTLHSSTVVESLQRMVSAFAPESQPAVRAQLADVLIAVVSQRLVFREDLGFRVPECEVMLANSAVRNLIRTGEAYKLQTVLETGRREGMWSRARYREWLARRERWHVDDLAAAAAPERPQPPAPAPETAPGPTRARVDAPETPDDDVIVIDPETRSVDDILSEFNDP